MGYLSQSLSGVGGRRVIVGLGGLYVGVAGVLGSVLLFESASLTEVVGRTFLTGIPGTVLLYGGYRLPEMEIHSELYQLTATWTIRGFAVMLTVLVLMELISPSGVDNPLFSLPFATALGSVGGLAVGIHDARSETRLLEAEQRKQEVERYSRDLERENERLESFAGMLAHEFRNPLQIAQIYLQQAQPRNDEATEKVEDAHDRMQEMVDVLLITVRGAGGAIDYQQVAIAHTAQGAWTDATEAAQRKTATLDVATAQTIRADPVHVEHLLRNLFRNSFEHGDEGLTVRVGALRDGFYVEDDGPGIPEDVRDDVVEAGFTTKAGGIGLGLTFVAQLVELYEWNWRITESEAGGARFEFTGVDLVSTEEAVNQSEN
jgi:signal transduction histidine kinase